MDSQCGLPLSGRFFESPIQLNFIDQHCITWLPFSEREGNTIFFFLNWVHCTPNKIGILLIWKWVEWLLGLSVAVKHVTSKLSGFKQHQ